MQGSPVNAISLDHLSVCSSCIRSHSAFVSIDSYIHSILSWSGLFGVWSFLSFVLFFSFEPGHFRQHLFVFLNCGPLICGDPFCLHCLGLGSACSVYIVCVLSALSGTG